MLPLLMALASSVDQVVVGYLPEYRMHVNMTRLAQGDRFHRGPLLTDLVLFSLSPNQDGSLDRRIASSDVQRAVAAASEAGIVIDGGRSFMPMRVSVCVGGAGRSTHFAAISRDERARLKFAKELASYVADYELDGVDFDWEGGDFDAPSLVALIAALKSEFGKDSERLITVAIHGWEPFLKHPDIVQALVRLIDRFHLMTYDGNDGAGRHATLQQATAVVESLVKQGLPSHKIAMGVAVYGRHMQQPGLVKTYSEIIAQYNPKPSKDEAGGIYFNGPRAAQAKAAYARNSKLAGVMLWEVGHDTEDVTSLLSAIAAEADGPKAAKRHLKRHRKYQKLMQQAKKAEL